MSCLGKVCTVQHRNRDCRGGRKAQRITILESENEKLRAVIKECVEVLTTCEINQGSIMHDKLIELIQPEKDQNDVR
jgi:hypothetical protein